MPDIIILDMNSPEIQYLCKKDKRLAKVISLVGPIEYTPREVEDGYTFLVHEIIEQMLSIKAGRKIYSRLEELCNSRISPEKISLLSIEDIRATGTSAAKAKYIQNVTKAVLSGNLDFSELEQLPDAEVMKKLTSIQGIGNWTAKMYLLFVLNRPDILPYEDGAFLQSYRWMYKTTDCTPNAVKKKCKKWSPYSSIASRYLYRVLDQGLTKEEFHLFK